MATLTEAEQARDSAAEQLRQLGAHAVSVEPEAADAAGDSAESSYAVVAWFDHDPPASMPQHVEVGAGAAAARVPVRVNRSARFQLE